MDKAEIVFQKIKKYNPWEGPQLQLGHIRSSYLNQISNYIGTKLIKVLVGQRRAGKSYVLRQIMDTLVAGSEINPRNIFYVNKEYTAFDDIKDSSDLEELFLCYKSELGIQGKIYLFLDEIQNINNWEKFVNSYAQDFTGSYELFISGSNSKLLSGELATLLSGRYVEFEVFPFDYSEYIEIHNQETGKDSYTDYIRTSGLPELIHLDTEELQRNYISSLKNTVVLRDIIGRHKIKDLPLLDDLFKFLTLNAGNLTTVSSIIKYFKSRQKQTNFETLSSYIEHLTDTFVFHQAERYKIRGKQVLGGSYKYYLNDPGFKNYIYGFYPSDMGYNLENQVFLQLRRMGYKVWIGVLNNLEIDFVARKADKTIYLQVSYLLNSRKTVDREFGNLLQIKDNYPKYVVSMDDVKFSDYEGIIHINPWDMDQI